MLRPILALLLVLSACALDPARVHPRADEQVLRGYRYLDQGDLERADVAFEHALAYHPGLPEALNGAGIVARRRERYDEARRRFEEAIRSRDDFAEARVNLGELAVRGGRLEAGAALFRDALAINPDLVAARLDLARTLVQRSFAEPRRKAELRAAARREYLHLLETAPELPEAKEELALMAKLP